MARWHWIAGVALAGSSAIALAQQAPESLLPPGMRDPSPAPSASATAAPRPSTSAAPSRPSTTPAPPSAPASSGAPAPSAAAEPEGPTTVTIPDNLPSLRQIEAMSDAQIEELFGLKPSSDIPPAARRELARIGVLGSEEGGFAVDAVSRQPAGVVRAALSGIRRPLVSRWGHILVRRALASRMDAPEGMSETEFAALRTYVLNRIVEPMVARSLVQDIDSARYSASLAGQALTAALASGDITAICPVAQLRGDLREDPQWRMAVLICDGYAGDNAFANRQLNNVLSNEEAPQIDVLLAQRYAGVAGEGRRAVTIEWDGVEELNDWRWGLASALGLEIPDELTEGAPTRFSVLTALSPSLGLARRAEVADIAGARGVLSNDAMVDLYSQIYADQSIDGPARDAARQLRSAYVGDTPVERLAAMRALWGDNAPYGRLVLTARAAARLPVQAGLAEEAGAQIVASMLSAGLDRNAILWARELDQGTAGWAQLAVAQPSRESPVSSGAVDSFVDNDGSADQRKSKFFVAGLAGLGRIDDAALGSLGERLDIDFERETKWSRAITRAAQGGNPALVAFLAGLGMQGSSWSEMTPRHLYHIVRSLNAAGLNAEARMIAAEAIARG